MPVSEEHIDTKGLTKNSELHSGVKYIILSIVNIKKITEKITLPIAIVVAAVIFGIAFYIVQSNKQQSIEKQQALELQEQKVIEEAKAEQAQKEYVAKRKTDCLDIYKTEGAKWNNVRGWRYDENDDLCYITYKESNPKTKAQCEKALETSKEIFAPDPAPSSTFVNYLHCIEGTFENSF